MSRTRVEGRYVVAVGAKTRTFRSADCLSVEFADGCYRRALAWLSREMDAQGEPRGTLLSPPG